MGRKAHDLTGHRYGLWTVLRLVGSFSDGKPKWLARCDCGAEREVRISLLKAGSSRSCGCLRDRVLVSRNRTHGLSKHPMYRSWRSMLQRCYNERHPCYAAYGGRGIRVCDRWRAGFLPFYEDMRCGFFDGATIDRVDMDGGYAPSNCRWVSREENIKRKRSTIYVEYRGVSISLRDLAKAHNLIYATVWKRFRNGSTLDNCLVGGR